MANESALSRRTFLFGAAASAGAALTAAPSNGGATPAPREVSLQPLTAPRREPSFRNFVVGPSNEVAFAAALLVARHPGTRINPLFICGDTGLGKSHLTKAIRLELGRTGRPGRVRTMSAEMFAMDYVLALRKNRLRDFRHSFLGDRDVLQIEDLGDLARKRGTQRELYHVIRALHDWRRQIVITATLRPHEMSDFDKRLVSRFRSGLVAHIDKPDYQMRFELVRKEAAERCIEMPLGVSRFIAEHVRDNARLLQGAVTTIAVSAMVQRRPISVALAERALQQLGLWRRTA